MEQVEQVAEAAAVVVAEEAAVAVAEEVAVE